MHVPQRRAAATRGLHASLWHDSSVGDQGLTGLWPVGIISKASNGPVRPVFALTAGSVCTP